MSFRPRHSRISRWLAMLSLATFGALGVFGHSLHVIMPCADGSCGDLQFAAEEHCCSCHHEHAPSESASATDQDADGPQYSAAGHDPDDCSLCTLLAKIKVGRLEFYHADVQVGHSAHELTAGSVAVLAELNLSGAPRGPPLG